MHHLFPTFPYLRSKHDSKAEEHLVHQGLVYWLRLQGQIQLSVYKLKEWKLSNMFITVYWKGQEENKTNYYLWKATNVILPYTRHKTIFPALKSSKFVFKPIPRRITNVSYN